MGYDPLNRAEGYSTAWVGFSIGRVVLAAVWAAIGIFAGNWGGSFFYLYGGPAFFAYGLGRAFRFVLSGE